MVKLGSEPIRDQIWEAISADCALPSLGQVSLRLSELVEDPEPVMQQLVRVFLSGLPGARCPSSRPRMSWPQVYGLKVAFRSGRVCLSAADRTVFRSSVSFRSTTSSPQTGFLLKYQPKRS
jgi:hypothetical protein